MTDPFEFDVATAVEPTDAAGTYALAIDPGFTVGPKPNGGYLVAAAARAAGLALAEAGSSHRDPLVTTSHFLSAPDPGPATVTVEVLRTGRSASQARATIVQGGRTCVDVALTVGTLGDDAPAWSAVAPAEVPPLEACIRIPARQSETVAITTMDRSDLRLDPRCLEFTTSGPSGRGEMAGWISFADGRATDPLGMIFFLDALPPATFDIGPSGWVPTLSLTTYLRARPTPGPLRVRQRAQVVTAGRVDEVCELWDERGVLVGQATQLAAVRFRDESSLVPPPAS